MHASVSVEYECNVSLTTIVAIVAAAVAHPRFTSLEVVSLAIICDLCCCIFFFSTATLRCLSPSDAAAAAAFFFTVNDVMD